MKKLALLLILSSTLCFAQADSPKEPVELARMQFLVGEWTGTGSGQPGQGAGGFSLKPDLDGHVLVRRSFSEYPAANGRPAFRHEDLMTIYEENGKLRAIYFDTEEHVIHYAVTTTPDSAMFVSDGEGPRFRLTYKLLKPDTVNIKFEMAPPGSGEFKTYVEGAASRKPGKK